MKKRRSTTPQPHNHVRRWGTVAHSNVIHLFLSPVNWISMQMLPSCGQTLKDKTSFLVTSIHMHEHTDEANLLSLEFGLVTFISQINHYTCYTQALVITGSIYSAANWIYVELDLEPSHMFFGKCTRSLTGGVKWESLSHTNKPARSLWWHSKLS